MTNETEPTQEEIDQAYKDLHYWLLRIKFAALLAIEKGEEDV